jgi:hypothetical protein
MLWITRRRIRVNRAATGWLIRRFLDPDASFRFVEPQEVAGLERRDGAIGFDAPGVRYPHQDRLGRCSFEVLAAEYHPTDAALRALARIVHDADFPRDPLPRPRKPELAFDTVSLLPGRSGVPSAPVVEAAGLRAISQGFPLVTRDDHETLERSGFLYEALYASLRQRVKG